MLQPLTGQLSPLGTAYGARLPAGLPRAGLLALWYAGDGTAQHSSIVGAGDSQPVDSWRDLVAGRTLAHTSTNRPNYNLSASGLNNRGALDFDGSSQHLYLASSGIIGNLSTWGIYAVAISEAGTGFRDIYTERNSGNNTPAIDLGQGAASAVRFLVRDDAGTNATLNGVSAINDNIKRLLVGTRSTSAFTARVNGSQVATGTASVGAMTTDSIAIGASRPLTGGGAGIQFWDGKIALVAIYSTDSNLTEVEAALNAHYAIY